MKCQRRMASSIKPLFSLAFLLGSRPERTRGHLTQRERFLVCTLKGIGSPGRPEGDATALVHFLAESISRIIARSHDPTGILLAITSRGGEESRAAALTVFSERKSVYVCIYMLRTPLLSTFLLVSTPAFCRCYDEAGFVRKQCANEMKLPDGLCEYSICGTSVWHLEGQYCTAIQLHGLSSVCCC